MFDIQTVLQVTTILLALAGAYLVAHTAQAMRRRIDYNILKAKVFLNDSFMRDNWKLLFLASLFFLINATVELSKISGFFTKVENLGFIQQVTVLGVLSCSFLSEYKWFKLLGTSRNR